MENNKSVTAVEWLFQQLWDEPKDKFTWYALLKEAKAMEKQQIIKATYYGHLKGFVDNGVENSHGEQYYNETYEK